ncbi:MAG TPA: hypothetical protein VGR57_20610 [Ktedonobacterales bacterium]|nr:hypothetical protein [Ktedonobacterales bacterium]
MDSTTARPDADHAEHVDDGAALAERVALLERLVSQQQEQIAGHLDRIERQEMEIANQRAALSAQRALALPAAPPPALFPVPDEPRPDASDDPAAEATTERAQPRRNSRRALLKLGGAAAAVGVAAVAVGATDLAHPGTAHATGPTFQQTADNITHNIAIEGDGTTGAVGVEGTSDVGIGVSGLATGQNGIAASGYASGIQGIGVWGSASSTGGIGVYGSSSTGYGGAFSGVLAPLRLQPAVFAGPPSSGNHNPGEMYVDGNGVLWYCAVAGTPGLWFRITGVVNGIPGGALNYLAAPIRIFDSRAGQPAPLPMFKLPLAGGSTTGVKVIGATVGGLSVPVGASGVFGNLTVTNTQGPGDLILYPSGATQPTTSNINYGPGQTVANAVNVGLSLDGKFVIYVHVSTTDVIFDIAGYVL